jgi:hypothetical protein
VRISIVHVDVSPCSIDGSETTLRTATSTACTVVAASTTVSRPSNVVATWARLVHVVPSPTWTVDGPVLLSRLAPCAPEPGDGATPPGQVVVLARCGIPATYENCTVALAGNVASTRHWTWV